MADSTVTEIGRITRKAIVGALKSSGEKAQAIVETTTDLVKATIGAVSDFTVAVQKTAGEIVTGTIEAAADVGEDIATVIKVLNEANKKRR